MAFVLTKKSNRYRVEFRFGWNGWLAPIHDYMYTSTVGQELREYWERLWGLLVKDHWGFDVKTASRSQKVDFLILTRMVVVVVFTSEELTKKQLYSINYYVKNKILDDDVVDWIFDQLRDGW